MKKTNSQKPLLIKVHPQDNVEIVVNAEGLPVATKIPAPLPPLEGYTFLGYRNSDGSVGTKNLLGITTTVQCVEGVLNLAVAKIKHFMHI